MLSPTQIISHLFLLLLTLLGSGKNQPNLGSPNIIFLLTDDLRYDALGFMGNPKILTPNLDKLASESVVFTNSYHVSPICKPSRAGIMIGQYLGAHGAGFDRPTNRVITEKEFEDSYPMLLKQAGYFIGFIGKFGFPVRGNEKLEAIGWENREENLPVEAFDVWNGFPGQGSYFPRNGMFNGHRNTQNSDHLNKFMGHQAIDFIKKADENGQPFCLSVSFKAPHAPFTPEPDMRALYDNITVPRMHNDHAGAFARLPKVVQSKSRNALRYFGKTKPHLKSWHLEEDEIYTEFIKNYYALISGVDRVIGRITKELKKRDLTGKTVIIFTSDNGFFCGSRQLTGKALLYEESVKAPLVVYDPNQDGIGRIEEGLISHVDIAPTILDYAGLKKPESMHGKSFLSMVDNLEEEIHTAVFGENNFDRSLPVASETENPNNYQSIRSKFVRTKDYKFIRYHECRPVIEELWDIGADPAESQNLIDDPQYKNTAYRMREKLDQFEERYVEYYSQ